MKKLALAGCLLGWGMVAQAAPGVAIYGGVYSWQQTTTGTLASTDQQSVDFDKDLGFDKDDATILLLGVEHAVPLLPNVRVQHLALEQSAKGELTKTVTIDGTSFTAADKVVSDYDISMTDLTLYYTPWDTFAKIDLGLTARKLDIEFNIQSTTQSAKLDASATLPMVFAGVSAKLPKGFYATAEVNAIGYSGNRFTDGLVKAGWHSPYLLGVEAGYRAINLTLDDVSDMDAELDFKGPYVALSLSF